MCNTGRKAQQKVLAEVQEETITSYFWPFPPDTPPFHSPLSLSGSFFHYFFSLCMLSLSLPLQSSIFPWCYCTQQGTALTRLHFSKGFSCCVFHFTSTSLRPSNSKQVHQWISDRKKRSTAERSKQLIVCITYDYIVTLTRSKPQ